MFLLNVFTAFRILGENKSVSMKPDLLNLLWSCSYKCGGHIASNCIASGQLEIINSGVLILCLSVPHPWTKYATTLSNTFDLVKVGSPFSKPPLPSNL